MIDVGLPILLLKGQLQYGFVPRRFVGQVDVDALVDGVRDDLLEVAEVVLVESAMHFVQNVRLACWHFETSKLILGFSSLL